MRRRVPVAGDCQGGPAPKGIDARIINTSSGAGLQGGVGQGNYSAKAGVQR